MKVFKKILNLYSIRDFLWTYPENLLKIYSKTKLLSSILMYTVIGIYLFQLLAYPALYSASFGFGDGSTSFTEGLVGEISSFNPMILTGSDIDRGLFNLIYTKLIVLDKNGMPQPALATSWEESDGGRTIRFTISDEFYWHDGEKVTSDDVAYTFNRAVELADAGLDTFGSSFTGVSITAESDNSVVFKFEENVAAVYESLSVYIIPKHTFERLSESQTLEYGKVVLPIGSGLYKIDAKTREIIELSAWDMHETTPAIKNFTYLFFPTVDSLEVAFKNNLLDAVGNVTLDTFDILDDYDMYHSTEIAVENRKKVLYMNLRDEKFQSIDLRQALAFAVNKEQLVADLPLASKAVGSTVSSNSWAYSTTVDGYYPFDIEKSGKALDAAGYKFVEGDEYRTNSEGETLVMSLLYFDSTSNDELVDLLEKMFHKVGIKINRRGVTIDSLVNEALATRQFDLLISELEVTSDPDQYNLWHSTKVNYPDLNISGYEYNRVDILLEGARSKVTQSDRKEDYLDIQKFIGQDVPAIVLFEPAYVYIVSDRFTNLNIEDATFPYDRYWNIENWEVVE